MPSEKWLSFILPGIQLWAFLLLPSIRDNQMLKFMMNTEGCGNYRLLRPWFLRLVLRHQISTGATHLIRVLFSVCVYETPKPLLQNFGKNLSLIFSVTIISVTL